MKKILGLDLGTTSIGWSFIHEAENDTEVSSIINTGVRIVPLSTDEEADFKKGNTISINADRTLKRGARRGLQRFKQRRNALLSIFRNMKFISNDFVYAENGVSTTFSSYEIRAKAATERVTKEELVKVLLMLNKKRGYKSSRKAKTIEEGEAIDGMAIAKELFENNLTPGQWIFNSLSKGGKFIPDFYRSDLQKELERIVNFQRKFYPEVIDNNFLEKNRTQILDLFKQSKIELAENKGSDKKLQLYKLRNNSINNQVSINEFALIISELTKEINKSSGYLGAISDRSKELYFNKQTVGQFQYNQLKENAHSRLKNQVFYRQDYMDEFETIWETQAQFYSELTEALKTEVRDITIFYQRKLKSQKHLISQCEFEKGHKAIPKSSPLFQEIRLWQNLNNIELKNNKEKIKIEEELKIFISKKLQFVENLSDTQFIKLLLDNSDLEKGNYSINFKKIEGNRTNTALFKAFEKILIYEGYDELDISKMDADDILKTFKNAFEDLKLSTALLEFDAFLQGNDFDKQPYYQLWHLLYSTEEDETLRNVLITKFGFKQEHVPFLLNVSLQAYYGSLSARAIKKILPHLKDGHIYDKACLMVGYNHSSSLTKEDNDKRVLKERLDLIKKNSLRNPVVEKILNQMVNVINAIIDNPEMGRPDEIRVELARELKNNNEQRSEITKLINKSTAEHEQIRQLLHKEYGIARVTKNDIIRYKLWKETEGISIYTGKPIEPTKLFSKEYDIEHIIPKSRLFDDSFSNKTICERQLNIDKSNKTAYSFLKDKLSAEEFEQFEKRVKSLFGKISRTKQNKLLMADNEIPEGFIDRQLRETQYIAKKSKELLLEVSRTVTSTIGSVTDKLREDWELVEVMKELNWDKYHKQGLTEEETGKNGERLYKIKDWTKRNDHRHHAMDAITVAFTKPAYIQYLNNLNARTKEDKKGAEIYGIETKYLEKDKNGKLRFKKPIVNFREEAKKQLESILISYKAKNKVVTKNKNITKIKGGSIEKIQLTPRGRLHEETVFGINQWSRIELSKKTSKNEIEKISDSKLKEFLKKHIIQKGSIAKAFSDEELLKLKYNNKNLREVKVDIPCFTQKINISKVFTNPQKTNSAKEKNIKNILDLKIREIITNRVNLFNGDYKKAFSNLEENPIWLNEKKGISIKSVTISGVSNAQALHTKKDHLGNVILDKNGNPIPVDFVSTGNNHHVAIYRDEKGNLQDEVVSFYDAVIRQNLGLSVINKNHEKGWDFLFSMKQNEFFIFPSASFNPHEIDLFNPKNYSLISPNLFRVQKFSRVEYGNSVVRDYVFRHHQETTLNDVKELKDVTYKSIKSLSYLNGIIKVRLNHLGQIIKIGEY